MLKQLIVLIHIKPKCMFWNPYRRPETIADEGVRWVSKKRIFDQIPLSFCVVFDTFSHA